MEKTEIKIPAKGHGVMVKLFVEHMLELTHDLSWDNYRHFAMDILSRLREASLICKDIRSDILPRTALNPIIEELSWSIEIDPIIASLDNFDRETFVKLIQEKDRPIGSLINLLHNLRLRISATYKSDCEKQLLKNLDERNKKEDFLKLIKIYCSHLICNGYHRKHICEQLQLSFLADQPRPIGKRQIKAFFSTFTVGTYQYRFYAKAERHSANALKRTGFLETISLKLVPRSFVQSEPNFFRLEPKELLLVIDSVAGPDAHSARRQFDIFLGAARAVILSVQNRFKPEWNPDTYAVKHRAKKGIIISPPMLPLDRRPQLGERQAMKAIRSMSGAIIKQFDQPSASRFLRSLNTSSLARTSLNLENQFISLWSAVEVLLSEPQGSMPRILHYVNLLLPCLCLRYTRGAVVRFQEDMQKIYGAGFSNLVRQAEPQEVDQFTAFTKILSASEHVATRKAILAMCSDSPLALQRFYTLTKHLSSPRCILKFINHHENMVRWQLHRIYRVRNYLVHSGRNPEFLEATMGNLDEYYRVAINNIVRRARKLPGQSNIDEVVSDINLEYQMYRVRLTKHSDKASIVRADVVSFIPA